MEFEAFEPEIEVNGQTVYAIVDGFTLFRHAISSVLESEGIGKRGADGSIQIDPAGWYSQEAWLRSFARIARSGSGSQLFQIGQRIPENAQFPPWVVDIHTAIQSINIAYHMNHRKQGKVMFDPETKAMLDGIGTYGFQPVDGESRIISVCNNPYPCEFDRGIITAMATKFEPNGSVVHGPDSPCRKKHADSCTYIVTW